jgi:hypothetical protein
LYTFKRFADDRVPRNRDGVFRCVDHHSVNASKFRSTLRARIAKSQRITAMNAADWPHDRSSFIAVINS